MIQTLRAVLVAALLAVAAAGCSEQGGIDESDIQAELDRLRGQIADADEAAKQYRGDLLGEMAETRRQVLLLSAAMLENRLIASNGGVPAKLVAPAMPPNPARAERILQHIATAEEELERMRDEAADRQGVAGTLTQTAVVTQELTLAQLRLAYYQSAYGIALPGQQAIGQGASNQQASNREAAGQAPAGQQAPDQAAAGGVSGGGASGGGSSGVGSSGGGAAGAPASAPPSGAQDVGALLDNLRKRRVEPLETAAPREPTPAPESQRHYSRDDYVRIQLLLQEAGFDPGPIDGHWGPRTQGALSEFQRFSGLPASGQPTQATLDALGFNG